MPRPTRRLGGPLRRLDRTVGRAFYRGVGVVVGLMALGTGRALLTAVARGHKASAAVLVTVTSALGALAVYCFGRGRRLSEAEL